MRYVIALAALCVVLGAGHHPAHAQIFSAANYAFSDEPVEGEVDIRATVRVGDGWTPSDVARIVFCYRDDANCLYVQMTQTGSMLCEVRDGATEVLASHSGWPPGFSDAYPITIMRRSWAIRVLCGHQSILRAYDEFAPGEKVGAAGVRAQITDLHVQPIGEMMFDDDFARTPDEGDPWEVAAGKWAVRLPETRNRAADPVKSANPFVFCAQGDTALALAGESFWDGYRLSAAVNPASAAAVGLACCMQDAHNGYLFRVTPGAEIGRAELLSVVSGTPTVLAEGAVTAFPGKWLQLAVTTHDGHLEGFVDGKSVVSACDETFSEGRIGLYAEKSTKTLFDDVHLDPYRSFVDGYALGGDMPVEQRTGTWTIYQDRLCGRPDAQAGMAVALTGCTAWRNYALAVDVLPWTATRVGVYFGAASPTDYYLFRWGAEPANPQRQVQELWEVAGGNAALLARRDAPWDPRRIYRVEAIADRSYLAVSVDGQRVLEAADLARPSAGQVGYCVEGSAQAVAAFDNMRVAFLEPPPPPVSITEQFAKEDTMADWARPLASWRALGGRLYAYTLPVWGDFDLRIELSHLIGRDGRVGLRLAKTTDALAEAGDCLQILSTKTVPELQFNVSQAQGGGETGAAAPQETQPMLELERRGNVVLASLDGKPVAWARAPGPDEGSAVGLKLDGVGVNLNNATLVSTNIIDESFSSAPTGWSPAAGIWDISDRWNCQPQWSWFCGRGAVTPLIWSKREFRGDMVFEFWAAMMMDGQGGGTAYSHPSDINCILAGDGKNLCSGYAFVYAGDNNTRGKIIRRGQTVAETTAFRFANPTTADGFHRHWFHCRIERTGGHLAFSVDGAKALEYDDPEPLSGGHVGFWTHQGNGILIARTRIAFRGQ